MICLLYTSLQLVGGLRRAGGYLMPPYEGDALCVFHNSAHRGDAHRRAQRVLGVDVYPLAAACSAGVGCYLNLPLNIVRSECICREVVPGLRTADSDTLDVLLSLCAVAPVSYTHLKFQQTIAQRCGIQT